MPLANTSELALHTRRENQIANEINREPVRFGDVLVTDDLQRKFHMCTHRPVNPSRKYNCHGLTFGSRRTWIEAPEIAKILKDDEYDVVDLKFVLPGDIAIYYSANGEAEHSGLVTSVSDLGVPIILSKWGACHEVVHQVPHSEYDAANVVYYRIST
jgi:hypothetical protein